MRRVRNSSPKDQASSVTSTSGATQLTIPIDDGTAMLALIQELIPLGLKAVEQALPQEVTALAGLRYAHDDARPELVRWGKQPGSVYLADQKVPRSRSL